MMTPTTVTYKVADGHPIKLDLYRPAGVAIAPVVVWLHGGALIAFSRRAILQRRGILEACLAAGLAVAAIDYRLAPETKLPAILDDVRDAFAWVQREGAAHGLNPARVGVLGLSAGGYLALMSAFMVTPRPRVVVSYYGYGDIAGDWYARPDAFYNQMPAIADEDAWSRVGTAPISEPDLDASLGRMRFYYWTRQHGSWPTHVFGPHPRTSPAAFGAVCPIQNIDDAWPPTMLLHGTADTDVPYEQSTMMLDALAAAGVPATIRTLVGAPHVFDMNITLGDLTASDPTPVARACADSVAFLADHLLDDRATDTNDA